MTSERRGARNSQARRKDALERLPLTYALALHLRDKDLPEEEMAERLGVEPEALGLLLELAEAKLAAILEEESGP